MLPILPRNSMKSCKCKKTTVMSYLPRLVTSLKKELLLMITKGKILNVHRYSFKNLIFLIRSNL